MRDNQMYALYQNGLSIRELSLKYEITSQRVRNILHDIKRELSLPAFQQHLNIRTVNALKAAGYVLTDDTDKLDEQAIRDALASGQLRVGQFIDARKFTQAQYDDLTRALKLPAKAEEPTSINPRTAPKPKRDKTGSKRAIRPSTSRDHQALCLRFVDHLFEEYPDLHNLKIHLNIVNTTFFESLYDLTNNERKARSL